MQFLAFLGRIMFGLYFIYQGYNHFKNATHMTAYAKHKNVPKPATSVLITGVLLAVGGLGMFLNASIKMSAVILLIFMIPTTFMMHAFWKEKDSALRMNEQIAFFKNMALVGALLMMLNF